MREIEKVILKILNALFEDMPFFAANTNSDWDFLILTDSNSNELTDKIRHKIYEVEWDTGEVLSSIVRSRKEWNSRRYRVLPFHHNIDKEGMSSSKHTGVRSLFNLHYVKTGKVSRELAQIYNDLFEKRQEGDYIDFVRFDEKQVKPLISETQKFLTSDLRFAYDGWNCIALHGER